MIIECPSCHSKYQYDEERFERKPSKKIKCARCQEIFEISNPAYAPRTQSADADRTFAPKKEPPKPETPPDKTDEAKMPGTGRQVPVAAPTLPAGKRLSLAILDGPDAGNVFRIDKPRVTIGRSNADLTLNDSEASRQHAAIEIRDGSIQLSDLGSTNGTICEGAKITDAVELTDKAEFQVGSTTLMLIVTEDH